MCCYFPLQGLSPVPWGVSALYSPACAPGFISRPPRPACRYLASPARRAFFGQMWELHWELHWELYWLLMAALYLPPKASELFGWAQPRARLDARRRAAAQGGGATPPALYFYLGGRLLWVGEGLWGYQEGQMGKQMVRFGPLRLTRSRQDESMEVRVEVAGFSRLRGAIGCMLFGGLGCFSGCWWCTSHFVVV
jgi:hypothetical protein